MDEHRRRLDRLATRRAVTPLKKLYDQAAAELTGKLRRLKQKDTFTAFQHKAVLAQVKQGSITMAKRLAGELGDVSEEAQTEALAGLGKDLRRLERTFTGASVPLPIDEASRFAGIIDKRKTSLLKMHSTSMARYGSHVVKEVQDQLALSMVQGENTGDAIDRVEDTIHGEWWQAERIVRTETAWAYNASHHDGILEAVAELPDLRMRWTEYVNDTTYAPFDDRVGVDSIAMHGQVADAGGEFVMPPTAPHPDAKGRTRVSESLVGERWAFPPNRPNDRSVILPWRPHWGIPGWEWRGRRVNL